MKNKIITLLLCLLMLCNLTVESNASNVIKDSDLIGTWDGTIIINQFIPKSLMVYLMEDGTGSYIDTTDEEIISSGIAAQVEWKNENDQLVLTYITNPEKQIRFSIVFNNGFLNLLSNDGVVLTRRAAAGELKNASEDESKAADIHVQAGSQTVLTDDQGVKITLTGKYNDDTNVIELETIIENHSETSIRVRAYPIANGWEAESCPVMGQTVSSGAKGKRPLFLFKEEIEANTYQELETLKVTFVIQDEFGNQLFTQKTGTIYFDDHMTAQPEAATPKQNVCSEEELLGEWVEIHYRDTMRLQAGGEGDNSYIEYRSANSYSSHEKERFQWEISGEHLLVTEKQRTFRETLGGKLVITREDDELVLSQGALIYKKVRKPIKMKLGEEASTDLMTFKPTKYSYASRVSSDVQPISSGVMFSPGEGRVWAIVHYQASSPTRKTISGREWSMALDYKDGILYLGSDSAMHHIEGGQHQTSRAPDFSASAQLECRTGFKVAEKMQNDKTSPLKLVVQLPSSEYGYEVFEFDIQ